MNAYKQTLWESDQLTRKIVQRINMVGGSFLGVSRGCPPLKDIVDKLEVN